MKTPREVLLARHKAAERKLDSVRDQVLTTLTTPAEKKRTVAGHFLESCRNCFRIPRFAWGGLAAAWLVIVVLNLTTRDAAPGQPTAFAQKRQPAETLQAVREQKRLLAELTGLIEKPEIEPPRFVPRPRSERRHEVTMV